MHDQLLWTENCYKQGGKILMNKTGIINGNKVVEVVDQTVPEESPAFPE